MGKYLDNLGLSVLWEKIKSLIPTIATSSKSGTVKSGGDIEVDGDGVVTVKYAEDLKSDKYLNKENSTQQSMKTQTVVTNLNADLIDGYHSIELFKLGNCNPNSIGPAFGLNAYNELRTNTAIGCNATAIKSNDEGYNVVLGSNITLKKQSYYPVEFTVGDSSELVYSTSINSLESITLNFKDTSYTITNLKTSFVGSNPIVIILPVELLYDSKKRGIYVNETLYVVDVIHSDEMTLSSLFIELCEKITINEVVYSIVIFTSNLNKTLLDPSSVSSDTIFKCTGVNDVGANYSTLVGFGSSGGAFSTTLGRKNYDFYQGVALGYENRNYSSNSVSIGSGNLNTSALAISIGRYNYNLANSTFLIGRNLISKGAVCTIGQYNEVDNNTQIWAQFAVGSGRSKSDRRTIFHIWRGNSENLFFLGEGKNDKNIELIFNNLNLGTNYSITYNNSYDWLEYKKGNDIYSIFPRTSGTFNADTDDIRILMRYKDVAKYIVPIKESLNNKVDRSEINLPEEFDVTYNLGAATSDNEEYISLFSVNDGYSVELLIAIEGPFGTYCLEKCVANCSYYPSITTDSTLMYYRNKLPLETSALFLMKLQPKETYYPNVKIRLKLLRAFRKDNTTVEDIYSAISWGEGTRLTNPHTIPGFTLKYQPIPLKPNNSSSIINLTQSDINNGNIIIDVNSSTDWFVKSDIIDSIDSTFDIITSTSLSAGTSIDFVFNLDFLNGVNLSDGSSILANYSGAIYKGDKLTFIVPESGDDWYVKLTPVSIMSTTLDVTIDDLGRTSIEVIPISDDKIIACCVL